MLYSTYGLTYDSEMDITIDMVKFAIEKETDDMLWDLYLVNLPKMDKKTYMNFNKFKKKAKQVKSCTKNITDDEIRAEAKAIQERLLNKKKEAINNGI